MAVGDFLLEDVIVGDFVPVDLLFEIIRVVQGGWKGGRGLRLSSTSV